MYQSKEKLDRVLQSMKAVSSGKRTVFLPYHPNSPSKHTPKNASAERPATNSRDSDKWKLKWIKEYNENRQLLQKERTEFEARIKFLEDQKTMLNDLLKDALGRVNEKKSEIKRRICAQNQQQSEIENLNIQLTTKMDMLDTEIRRHICVEEQQQSENKNLNNQLKIKMDMLADFSKRLEEQNTRNAELELRLAIAHQTPIMVTNDEESTSQSAATTKDDVMIEVTAGANTHNQNGKSTRFECPDCNYSTNKKKHIRRSPGRILCETTGKRYEMLNL